MMTSIKQKDAAKKFVAAWEGKGYERGQSQTFWLQLLENVYGVKNPFNYIRFEDKVHIDKESGFIDGYIDSTHTMIEQKSLGKSLDKPIKQSDGTLLTPIQQAKRYSMELPYSRRPRWIITCNFSEFYVYDMEQPNGEPEKIKLKNLPEEYYRLNFLVNDKDFRIKKEEEISAQAAEKVARLYNAFYKNYKDPTNPHSLKSLNMLCIRLVFCAYAEDAGLFGQRKAFENYIRSFEPENCRTALKSLFHVLDTKPNDRDPYEDKLNAFPYVNGGLFSDENIEIPQITTEIRDNIVNEFCEFDWSQISPTVFGAMFESTLNPDTRRSSGMHYTSIENIHKVIDPLFLDDLKEELQCLLKQYRSSAYDWRKNSKARQALIDYQNKLASLTFLDPACGSGNFLTETYLCLRRLENKVLEVLNGGQTVLGDVLPDSPIKVSISQFYGIEINDFAVSVAMCALWIAESQTLHETEILLHKVIDYLPLKSNSNIHEGNALKMDWENVISKQQLNYIMGNPPFAGKKEQSRSQKEDLLNILNSKSNGLGNLDYVTAWYFKAAKYLQGTNIKVAFVSTNSITQGEQVSTLWKQLNKYHIHIDFAYRTFKWDNEAKNKAAVHCVIIGFSQVVNPDKRRLYISDTVMHKVENINPYLINAPSVLIGSRSKSICNVPPIMYGSMPIDNGHLILSEQDVKILLAENSNNKQFIRPYAGGAEILHNTTRWCLWLQDASPEALLNSKFIMRRIAETKRFRKNSKRPQTIALASTPYLFGEIRQPRTNMLVIPKVSSENRRYIPIAFVRPSIIINGSALIIPNATLYHFGILSSNIHNAWMRTVAGRMKSDYQYSGNIVYNNFSWPSPTEAQKSKIIYTAHSILKARDLYPDCSLADLYNEVTMPQELRRAHQANDRAVMQAYGFSVRNMAESDCVAALMKLYQQKITELENENF